MSLLVGCPVILPPRDDVVASWDYRPMLLVVNGAFGRWVDIGGRRPDLDMLIRGRNDGVPASWNLIFRAARAGRFSHVALVSQGTVLDGGISRLASMVDEYADHRGLLTDFAFHCIVLSVRVWEQVGPFDEQFWPAYYEDADMLRRLELAGLHTPANPIPKIGRDLLDGTETFGAVLASSEIDRGCYGLNGERFRCKWLGDPGHEQTTHPYDDPSLDYTYVGPPPTLTKGT